MHCTECNTPSDSLSQQGTLNQAAESQDYHGSTAEKAEEDDDDDDDFDLFGPDEV